MAKFMNRITILSFITTLTSIILYFLYEISLFKTLSITLGTIFYHFFMRLIVGILFQTKFNNKICYNYKWFNVSNFECKFYTIIKVKVWKKYLPTYNKDFFDNKIHTYDEIAMAMCQSELVHESIILLSFLPIISSIWFGEMIVFVITSIFSAFIDLTFVLTQRYNRPRILRLLNKKTSKI